MRSFCFRFILSLATILLAESFPDFRVISNASAQTGTVNVSGQVMDDFGPLTGATVIEVGSKGNGTVTDINGQFSLTVKSGANLEISFIGYKTAVLPAKASMTVELREDNTTLSDVVIIGYGSQRKEAVTGSVANIGSEMLNKVAASNAASALQGRVAGVNMQQTSSQPGADMQIRIRGQRSLNASNDPLIVLDGIPFMGSFSDISPSDIKSLDILKDASATAIYGSRGANGVIIVTTVKGMKDTPARVTYNGYAGFKTVFHKYPMMDAEKYSRMREYAGIYTNSLDETEGTDTDWQDLFYRTGYTVNHDIGVTGGTSGGAYSFGAGYYKDESVIPSQGFDRLSLRGSFDQELAEWFRFGLNVNTSYRTTTGSNIGLGNILNKTPMLDPFNEDGSVKRTVDMPVDGGQFVWTRDVLESLGDSYIDNRRAFGSYNTLFAEIKCPWIEGLSYRFNLGLNFRSTKNGKFTGTGVGSSNDKEPNSASVEQTLTKNWAVENILSYDRMFADKHHLSLTGLFSSEQTTFEQNSMSGRDFPAEYFQYYQIGAAQSDLAVNPDRQDYWRSGLVSWMGRAMYTYNDRYMISAAIRADASSRLAGGHQWHTYPAISAGWNMAEEKFMDRFGWLESLKLRIGYGETSNQSIDPYSTLGALSTTYYNYGSSMATGYYVSTLPNPELGWEYSTTWNYGIDFSMFSGRLYGSFEYYIQNTHDLLLSVNLPPTSGVGSYMANVGRTSNRGFEFSVNGIIIDNRNGWNWDAGINISANRNRLEELASGAERDESNRWFVGYPIDVIYDYKKIGLWQAGEEELLNILEPGGNIGMIKVDYTGTYDENGMPTRQINPSDRQIISMEPLLQGGFNTTLSYKNFDFSVIGAFQIGGKLVSVIHSSNGYLNMLSGRRGQLDVDYWTEDNTDAKYPKPGGFTSNDNPIYGSTLGYFDAGYLKIRTMTLGYDFGKIKAVRDFGIRAMRLYVSVQNPFVLFSPYTKECGLDPETNSVSDSESTMAVTMDGYTGAHKIPVIGYNTPSTRNWLVGMSLTF